MDIKLKNNRKKRAIIVAAVVIILTFVNICFFPAIGHSAEQVRNEQTSSQDTENLDQSALGKLYRGCYILYLEYMQNQEGQNAMTASELFADMTQCDKELIPEQSSVFNNDFSNWSRNFDEYRSRMDYYVQGTVDSDQNTSYDLSVLLDPNVKEETLKTLQERYTCYFVVSFDETGSMTVDHIYSKEISSNVFLKAFQQASRDYSVSNYIMNHYDDEESGCMITPKNITSFQVVYAIPAGSEMLLTYDDYWSKASACMESGGVLLLWGSLAAICILMFVMTSKSIWKDIVSFDRRGHCYLMEASIFGIILVLCLGNPFMQMIYDFYETGIKIWNPVSIFHASPSDVTGVVVMSCSIFAIYLIWYVSCLFIRPLFSLGLPEYIRQYSLIYQIWPWIKRKWNKFDSEVSHIDFSEKSTKTIFKVVLVNFVILVIISCFWVWGIWALIVYSIVLFILLKRKYDRVASDYRKLMGAVNQIADGDLETCILEDIGVFEPFKMALWKIQSGFKKAVEEEVKSQRMKTELITNVSHDLKTPLTAITTYVELLKKEDITEEERRSYIDTLEKKSLRLKVLIEDLFEVSKASSNNITLNLMEMNVVNLLKQVSIEHTDKFEEKNLELRWNVPEEKVMVLLDNQKTYRIFENLFVNVQKYAMPGSRVFVDVIAQDDVVEIVMKNMSAYELSVNPEELTERFVRGDASRNTEGSGLGLAIAKSFTEAQKGTMHIFTDGDLFKVVIRFDCGKINTENAPQNELATEQNIQ